VGPCAVLERCGKSRPPPGFDPRTVQPVTSHYTDCAIPALKTAVQIEKLPLLILNLPALLNYDRIFMIGLRFTVLCGRVSDHITHYKVLLT
jgi:hypothetical protein